MLPDVRPHGRCRPARAVTSARKGAILCTPTVVGATQITPSVPPSNLVQSPLEENLRGLRQRLERAASAVGRRPDEIRILAVTKSVEPDVAADMARLGLRDLGENRAPELERKARALSAIEGSGAERVPEIRWHFIGHLQRNKARRVARIAAVIHSVDSLALLETLERIASEEDLQLSIYLQVDATGEARKTGFAPDAVRAAVLRAKACAHLELLGLMAMGPLAGQADRTTRAVFAEVAALARTLERDPALIDVFADGRCRLSMGMSGDLEEAVRAGTDLVRVGGALFRGTSTTANERPGAA
ncbi:MAG: YggS family pyridoxal phosphate-dependent enzyme [Planctomycetota bacterium]|nr:MAG: YggS family pyridoxal phosphate-dependent enzyme [Planctomycetota bacterium]